MTTEHQEYEARLLVVDDEPNIRDLLATSLRFAGFEVFTAATGNEAIQAATEHQPDLVVLDVMLPDGSGLIVADAYGAEMTRMAPEDRLAPARRVSRRGCAPSGVARAASDGPRRGSAPPAHPSRRSPRGR